ncbi:MAG: hypothetical protein M1819_003772 [Sarea resinae]|nr:MAG: hypothetical protein M1819_003772 [Sarea resinae]
MPRQARSAGPLLADRTLVVDNGAYTIKAGFASPCPDPEKDCHVIPNCMARSRNKRVYVGAQLESCKDFGEMMFRRPMEKGYLVNWEAEKEIWDHSFFNKDAKLKCDPHETNLILTEAPNALPALSTNTDQIVFEEYEFSAYYRCLGPPLNAYNDIGALYGDAARDSSAPIQPAECILLVDSGYSHTTITPVYQGRAVQRAIRRLDIGGKLLTNYLKELVSVRHYNMMDETHLMNEVKEAASFVSADFKADLERTWKGNSRGPKSDIVVDYVLPDYNTHAQGFMRAHDASAGAKLKKVGAAAGEGSEDLMTLGNERFAVPELLFSPTDIGMRQAGLAESIMQSLSALPSGLWPAMLANIVVVGGNARIQGFRERLEMELRPLAPTECVIRIASPPE